MAVKTRTQLKAQFKKPLAEVAHDLTAFDNLLDSLAFLTEVDPTLLGGVNVVAADTLAIPVDKAVVTKSIGADAEALTLADGTAGQILVISITAGAGGVGTLTPTTKTGFTTIAFRHAGEVVALQFIDATVGWVVLGQSRAIDRVALDTSTTVAADVLAIPVTHEVVLKTTGADGEALTLADGTIGQELTIVLVTDGGGDGTLTPTTCTGFATIVFADAGDQVTLKFVDATVGWVLKGAIGVAAPPAITV